MEDRFKAKWLAPDSKDKQAYTLNQELPTSPDAEPSGPLVSRGLQSDSSIVTYRGYKTVRRRLDGI